MNTRFRPQIKTYRKRRRTILFVVVILLVLVAAVGINPPSFLQGALYGVAAPIWGFRNDASESSRGFLPILKSKQNLQSENDKLFQEVQDTRLKLLDRDALKKENSELKKILGRELETNFVLASVVSRPSKTVYGTLIIDAGEREGIQPGSRVFAGESLLLGLVGEVFRSTSVVKLYSAPGFKAEFFLEESEQAIEASGKGGGTLEVELPKDLPVFRGNVLFSQGVNSYPVAVLEAVESNPADSFKNVMFRVPVNFSSLRFVQVESGIE